MAGNPMDALVHALMSIRGLPVDQRQAWLRQFEHYVFSPNAEALDHIPQAAQGVLANLNPEMLQQVRATLRKKLSN